MTPEEKEKAEKKKSDRHKEVRAAEARIENLRRVIEDSKKSIILQRGQLADLQGPISIKFKHLQKLRADIAEIKGEGIEEDVNFHIDRSRDDRGFTFLMLASQNDDFFTAKTCLALGADAYATSPEGLTAIDFSYFFEHTQITNLILQNGKSLKVLNRFIALLKTHNTFCSRW
jgi:ankyrin repeat protein